MLLLAIAAAACLAAIVAAAAAAAAVDVDVVVVETFGRIGVDVLLVILASLMSDFLDWVSLSEG